MHKKILGIFFTILFLGVVGVLYMLLDYTEEDVVKEVQEEYIPVATKQDQRDKKIATDLWISDLSKSMDKRFAFPVNEFFMQIELHKYISPKTRYYKLIVSNIDRYSVFCIVQTLSSFKIPFVFSKKGNRTDISISSRNPKILKKIVKKLKEYNIDSKIVKGWL